MLKQTTRYFKIIAIGIGFFSASNCCIAQSELPEELVNYDSLLDSYLSFDSLLLADIENDSLSFFDLIDSLLNVDFRFSTLSLRAGYTSSILNAGRDYGFSMYGFSTGVSYYHKTGLFIDALAYWNSEIDPNYYLNTFSAGYIGSITKKWSVMGSYDFLNYRKGDSELRVEYPFKHALNLSSYFDFKIISAGFDYSYLFGTESAHRLRPNIAGVIRTGKLGFIDRLTFMPAMGLLFGNSTIITTSTNRALLRQIISKIGWRRFLVLYERNQDEIDNLIYNTEIDDVFGLMNYSFALPVFAYVGNFTLMISYSLNLTIALPGEQIDTSLNSYFGTTLIYNINFK